MNWIDIVWPMVSAACLTLGLIHFLAWRNDRASSDHLFFSIGAACVASIAIFELLMMRSNSVSDYSLYLRWVNYPISVMLLALPLFVHRRFRAGSTALLVMALALRALCLVINFTSGVATQFSEISALKRVPLAGAGLITMPVGTLNPWYTLATFSVVVLMAYMATVIAGVARRGDAVERKSAVAICGSIIFFLLIAGGTARLVINGLITGPLVVSTSFAVVMIVISNELGGAVTQVTRIKGELKTSQLDLRESESQIELASQTAGLLLWSWDLERDELSLSNAGSDLFSITRGELVSGAIFLSRVHPDDRAIVEQERAWALERGSGFSCDFRIRLADGRQRWIASKGILQLVPAGGSRVIRGVMLDRTERWQAAERFRRVVEGAPVSMLMVDDAGRISLANEKSEQVFGYSRSELHELSLSDLLPKALVGSAQSSGHEVTDSRSELSASTIIGRRKDGSEVYIELQRTQIEINDSLFDLVSITDVGARLAAEREAAMQREELAHLSRVALLGELSGSLAHELNQPLTAILSNAQAALRFLDHDPVNLLELRESLVDIVDSDKRANEVIRRLRAMLRKEKTNYQLLAFNEVVADVFRLINSDILNRQVDVRFELDADLPLIFADRVQLQQVLLNLVINACDAMAEAPSVRVITVRTRLDSQDNVLVELVDTGSGIDAAKMESIFQPFITSKADGIGLGLAICDTIIRSHDGKLWATNNPMRGATFHISLPSASSCGDD